MTRTRFYRAMTTATALVVLFVAHHPAFAAAISDDGVAIPGFETQISLTDDSQLTCRAIMPSDVDAELF